MSEAVNLPAQEATLGSDQPIESTDQPIEIQTYDFCSGLDPGLQGSCEFEDRNFFKGVKWCAEGSLFLTCSENRQLHMFPLPEQFYSGDFSTPVGEMKSTVSVREGGMIYDYCWHPLLSSYSEGTCCFLSTSSRAPIHLWSCVDGTIIATYKTFNHVGEVEPAKSLAVSPDGLFLYAGFKKRVCIYDFNNPGSHIEEFKTYTKRQVGQPGIVSCFDFQPESLVFAVGSYDRSVGIYDIRSSKQKMIFEGHSGGVTQIKFTRDGNLLISGARKDNELLVWDLRRPGEILAVLSRNVSTNQRVYFDLSPNDSRYLASGGCDGFVSVWDLSTLDGTQTEQTSDTILKYQAHQDCVNGVSFHPTLPLLLTSSGQRHRQANIYDSDSDSGSETPNTNNISPNIENSLKLWWLGK